MQIIATNFGSWFFNSRSCFKKKGVKRVKFTWTVISERVGGAQFMLLTIPGFTYHLVDTPARFANPDSAGDHAHCPPFTATVSLRPFAFFGLKYNLNEVSIYLISVGWQFW